MDTQELLDRILPLAHEAGRAILDVYDGPHSAKASLKADDSPLTAADLASHRVIVAGLRALEPALPVLSEEAADIGWETRRAWRRYWLVDPLDGTKEFLRRNGEFTVNIALIDEGEPVLGVVYVPVRGLCYWGGKGIGAFRRDGETPPRSIHVAPLREDRPLRAVASRRHGGGSLQAWLAAAGERFPGVELLNMGSSLKICLVAEGAADVYPRLAPTSEWDTAAAQAVLEAAGGALLDPSFAPYRYNRKADILNPHFHAVGDPAYPWSRLIPQGSASGEAAR